MKLSLYGPTVRNLRWKYEQALQALQALQMAVATPRFVAFERCKKPPPLRGGALQRMQRRHWSAESGQALQAASATQRLRRDRRRGYLVGAPQQQRSKALNHMSIAANTVTGPGGEEVVFQLPSGQTIPIPPLVAVMPYAIQKTYADSFTDAFLEILEKDGPAAFGTSGELAAAHEAGHVIIGTVAGLRCLWSRIWRDKKHKQWAGWTECTTGTGRLLLGEDAGDANNFAAVKHVMAGYIAEWMHGPVRRGSSLDEQVAAFVPLAFMARGDRDRAKALHREAEKEVRETIMRNADVAIGLQKNLLRLAPAKLKGRELDALVRRIV